MNIWYSLVSLLPFEWAQPDTMFFMKNALLAIIVISPLYAILSTMVVTNRMSFFSDALGHGAFTGIAIGTLCGMMQPLWCAVLFAIAFALLFNLIRHRSEMSSDTIIGVLSSTALAFGIFLATFGGQSFTKYNNLLIGDILSVKPVQIALLALILLAVILFWIFSFNRLMLSSVHPVLAGTRGVNVFLEETIYSILIAIVVTITMTWVGLLVINAMLVLPAAASRNLSRNMFQYHLYSLIGSFVCGIAGLMISYYLGSSTGASITLFLAIYFGVSLIFRKSRL